MSFAFVEVAFPIPLNRAFHYAVPDALRDGDGPAIGARVLAPFGKTQKLVGYVVGETNQKPSFETKAILACLDHQPFVDKNLFELAKWLSERYLCSFGEALSAVAPAQLMPPKRPSAAGAVANGFVRPANGQAGRKSGLELVLSDEQQSVLSEFLAALEKTEYAPFVLRGITDSGKTELYLRTIDRALELGKQALFLLPEIALTPPFINRLKDRYSAAQVGLWHSGLTPNQRYLTWDAIRRGEIQVVLGARSAVFAPFPNLGVIVVDEEHEPTYKQEDRPKYHTREVALKRAQQTNAVVIMGSATPSLESYWRAKQGEFRLVELTSRVEQRMLPPVTLIDQRPPLREPGQPKRRKGAGYLAIFSEPMKLAIEQRLARREQVMLFVNRRGFTPFLRCGGCGWVARCTRCSTTLAFHITDEKHAGDGTLAGGRLPPAAGILQCHACLHKEPTPVQCPQCESLKLRQYGIGTQRVEQELRRLFPFVRMARLDHDVAGSRHVYERVYNGFSNGEIDVLVGTQMIAKGFDFPGVTLVGVIDADVSLHLPEFRAAERTFQLVAQVAGRTGRGEAKGKVLVQTHHPEHYALQAAQAHDFVSFYNEEIGHREALRYPPFCRLVSILIRGAKEPVVQDSATALFDKLQALGGGVDILGPAPAPYGRLRNQWRYQILLKGTDEALAPYLSFLRHYKLPKAFMSVDVDPVDLL